MNKLRIPRKQKKRIKKYLGSVGFRMFMRDWRKNQESRVPMMLGYPIVVADDQFKGTLDADPEAHFVEGK